MRATLNPISWTGRGGVGAQVRLFVLYSGTIFCARASFIYAKGADLSFGRFLLSFGLKLSIWSKGYPKGRNFRVRYCVFQIIAVSLPQVL